VSAIRYQVSGVSRQVTERRAATPLLTTVYRLLSTDYRLLIPEVSFFKNLEEVKRFDPANGLKRLGLMIVSTRCLETKGEVACATKR
jgi:hypothetical protein